MLAQPMGENSGPFDVPDALRAGGTGGIGQCPDASSVSLLRQADTDHRCPEGVTGGKTEFATDGFELLVRGRGEVGCRAL